MIPSDPDARRQLKLGLLFASPVLIGLVVFTLYPLLAGLSMALRHHVGAPPVVVSSLQGVSAGGAMPGDPDFLAAYWNTLIFVVLSVPAAIFVALALALLLNLPVRGGAFYQAVFFLPSIVPATASALMWRWFFPLHGWFTQPGQPEIKYVLILMSVWAAGVNMVLYRTAMRGVPKDLYDAADTEGASTWQRAVYVTLPALAPVLFFTLVVGIIGAFQVFAWPYIFAQGHPQEYLNAPSAIVRPAYGWTLFLMTAVCTGAVLLAGKRFLRTHEH